MSTFKQALANAMGDATGDGTAGTVLALHSLGLDGRSFDPLRACLSNTWRFISPDLPGHGHTSHGSTPHWEVLIDSVCDAVSSADLGPDLHLVGHSMGGAVAAQVASRLGARVASLTLIATPACGVPAFAERGVAALSQGMQAMVPATLQRWFGDLAHVASDGNVAYARDCLLSMAPQLFADAWCALAQFEGYGDLAEHLPATLFLSGELDVSTPPKMMAEMAEALARSGHSCVNHHMIAGAGHMVALTHSSAVAAYAQRHWQHRLSLSKRAHA